MRTILKCGRFGKGRGLPPMVLHIEDFTEAAIEAVRRAEPSEEAEAFNEELKL